MSYIYNQLIQRLKVRDYEFKLTMVFKSNWWFTVHLTFKGTTQITEEWRGGGSQKCSGQLIEVQEVEHISLTLLCSAVPREVLNYEMGDSVETSFPNLTMLRSTAMAIWSVKHIHSLS